MTSPILSLSYGADDVTALARLHSRSFPNYFLSRLGEPFLAQFYSGFIPDSSAVIVVARERGDGPILGVAVGSVEPRGFFSRLLRRQFWGFVKASVRATLRQPSVALRLLQALAYRGDAPAGRSGALLSSICVSPEASGKGLGSALLRAWLRRAQEMGAVHAFLTTDAVDNDDVNRWYVREGWRLSATYLAHGGRRMNCYEASVAVGVGAE